MPSLNAIATCCAKPICKSRIITSNHRAYQGLSYKHESVWAVLKRGYNGTFHHFSVKHLQRYVNEFTFRLNEGNCSIDTIDRINEVLAHSFGERLTYKGLIA